MNRAGIRRSGDAGDEALVEALSRAARALASSDSDGSSGPSPRAWHRLNDARANAATAATAARAPRARAFVLAGAIAAMALVSVGAALRLARTNTPLTFAVSGGDLQKGGGSEPTGGYVRATGGETQVRFSDGTEIHLSEGARLSVSAPGPRGARLRLDAGRARFQVVHLPHAAWSVEAGPFVVEVTGTVFDVGWSARDGVVEVHLQSGSVRVSGPLLQERVVLGAGQRLTARLGSGEVRIDDGRAAAAEAAAPPTLSPPAPTPGPSETPAPAAVPTTPVASVTISTPRPRPVGSVRAGGAVHAVVALRGERRVGGAGPARALPPPAEAAPAPAEPSAAATSASDPDDAITAADIATLAPPVDPNTDAHLVAGAVAAAATSSSTVGRVVGATSPRPTPAAQAPTAPRPVPNIWRQRRWSAQVAAGDSASVLTDAEQLGLGLTLGEADSSNLGALADAARYSGRGELAASALLVQRRRFPGTPRAQAAAFLLGRMADDRGDTRSGLQWYRHYLDETPNGAYAAEALGRQMLAIERLRGRPAARAIAGVYLRRFPNGTYLFQARAILENR